RVFYDGMPSRIECAAKSGNSGHIQYAHALNLSPTGTSSDVGGTSSSCGKLKPQPQLDSYGFQMQCESDARNVRTRCSTDNTDTTASGVYEIDSKLRDPKVIGSLSLLAMLLREKNLQTYKCALIPNVEQNFMGAKVVTDQMTRRTKSYGLVKFGDEIEQIRVMIEMNRRLCSTTRMRIRPTTTKMLLIDNGIQKIIHKNDARK
ncbi:hypothetical protein Tco_0736837, partial [Tanacetum coccineum]